MIPSPNTNAAMVANCRFLVTMLYSFLRSVTTGNDIFRLKLVFSCEYGIDLVARKCTCYDL